MINLKFYPDFFCYSLWVLYDDGNVENIDPTNLPISNELKNDISTWGDKYNAIYDDYPPNSNFKSKKDETEFFIQGACLYNRLITELPSKYKVSIGW
ncbi:hypothetical protein EDC51_101397 [Bibersteinia trehalosi]|uniref:hypothetical protein n=1 Tax=Bibersteinia trehalosi TaxID=47735 RepID=UPI00104E7456|nr:hypothetical protein [Bibersteinia trehalosi]TCT18673.1 hypothetical protein EDC51_101397 [Bibersteinia trehalosi]